MEALDSRIFYTFASYAAFTLVTNTTFLVLFHLRAFSRQFASICVFLAFLAIADITVLGAEVLPRLVTENDVTQGQVVKGELSCKAWLFFSETACMTSSWLTVAMLADVHLRLQQLASTHKTVVDSTRARSVSFYVVVIATAGALPLLVVTSADHGGRCVATYETFAKVYRKISCQLVVTSLAPMLTLVLILAYCMHTRRYKLPKTEPGSTNINRIPNVRGALMIALLFLVTHAVRCVGILLEFDLNSSDDALKSKTSQCVFLLNFVLKLPTLFIFEKEFCADVMRKLGLAEASRQTMHSGAHDDVSVAPNNEHLVAGRYNSVAHYEDNEFVLYRKF